MFRDVKVGDIVTRQIGPDPGPNNEMQLTVLGVDERLIHCGPWTFDRDTGGEIDEDLGWTATQTGSLLVKFVVGVKE